MLKGTIHNRVATLRLKPDTENMSFTFVSPNNSGKRHDWETGELYEELLSIEGASFDRLNTFFTDHSRKSTSAIGKVLNTRVENGEIVGEVKFGRDEVAQAVKGRYEDEILTDVSIGYRINKYDVKKRDDDIDLVTVTEYEIIEVSSVGFGFDDGAKKREKEQEDMLGRQRIAELEAMDKRSKKQEVELTTARNALTAEIAEMKAENKRLKDEAKESKRVTDIEKVGALYNATPELIARMIADPTGNVHTLNTAILDKRVADTPPLDVEVNGIPEVAKMRKEIIDAISVRMGAKPDLKDNIFAQASLNDMAARVLGIDAMDKRKVMDRAMVTSEFPALLLDAGNRTLEAEFAQQASTWKQWAQQSELRDFRPVDVVRTANSGGMLDVISENGELKEITRFEDKRTWKLQSYGNKAFLSREIFVNNDLGAFGNIPTDFAERAANRESSNIYGLLTGTGANFTMNDGLPIFHADHGNLGTAVFSSAALIAAKLAMRKQTSINGAVLDIMPEYLIVSPELEDQAIVLLTSPASIEDAKNASVVNTQYKTLTLIVDPRLKDPQEWYLMTGNKTITAGYLAGSGRTPKIQINAQSILGLEYQTVFDFTQTAVDYRGMYKGK